MVLISRLIDCLVDEASQVSVPLRGLWFLSPLVNDVDEKKVSESFRPLAGIMVLIAEALDPDDREYRGFPSPCGDYGSYLNRVRWED